MPDSSFIQLAIRMGRLPSELEEAIDNEPEWWRQRFWLYINAGGR
jgi:hypothetical protein